MQNKIEALAATLSKTIGKIIPPDWLTRDVAAGAMALTGGTARGQELIEYVAWLLKHLGERDDHRESADTDFDTGEEDGLGTIADGEGDSAV